LRATCELFPPRTLRRVICSSSLRLLEYVPPSCLVSPCGLDGWRTLITHISAKFPQEPKSTPSFTAFL
jgi:hypothetical protein